MSNEKGPVQQRASPKAFLTAKNIKDGKMSIAGFGTILFLMLHYAWIMRQWVLDPYAPTKTILLRFSIFAVNVVLTLSLLMYYIYPSIYREELEQEAAERKALEDKSH